MLNQNIPALDAPDESGTVNRLFMAFEAVETERDCGGAAEELAGSLFRFMMLDQALLEFSLARACDTNCGR